VPHSLRKFLLWLSAPKMHHNLSKHQELLIKQHSITYPKDAKLRPRHHDRRAAYHKRSQSSCVPWFSDFRMVEM